ncbi:MAG: tetratricopeptide repeat protein [candidate division WOR-3 bacterium]|nr:tetratricopeptide repeat protein [candidate division WOR-3 bacterium]MCX7948126.1 tetratricopeptide repeat protein [candidate division WOR-3 bacterium]MDW8150796.1 tetratricopeptide repeat protein [candidate division WOR-3 bacterium]
MLLILILQDRGFEEQIQEAGEYEVVAYYKPYIPYNYKPLDELKFVFSQINKQDAINIINELSNFVYPRDSILAKERLKKLKDEPKGIRDIILNSLIFEGKDYEGAFNKSFSIINSNVIQTFERIAYKIYIFSALNLGKYKEAYSIANFVIQNFFEPDSIIYYACGEAFYYAHEFEKVDFYSSKLYDNADINLRVLSLYLGGWNNLNLRRYNEALSLLNRSYEIATDNFLRIILQIGIAVAKFNLGDKVNSYNSIVSMNENLFTGQSRAELLYHRGMIAFYNKRDDIVAEKDFSRFIQDFPKDERAPFVALKLSDLYRFKGDIKNAISNLEWIRLNFDKIMEKENALYLLGELYLSQQDYQKSLYAYLELMDKFPTSSYASTARLRAEQILSKLATDDEKYIDTYKRYFPTSPQLPDVYYYWGGKYLNDKNDEKASYYFYRLALEFPESPKAKEAIFIAGQLFLKLKKWSDASETFKRLIRIYPEHGRIGDAYGGLALAYLNQNNPEGVISFLTKALREDRGRLSEYDKGVIYMYLGLAYESIGNMEKAREYLEISRNQFFGVGRTDMLEQVNQYLDRIPR